jgi:phosphoribosylformylglycinamidine cyclo-ligase
VFDWLQKAGNIGEAEMLRTFNCGIGMVLAVAKADAKRALSYLARRGETAWIVGDVRPRRGRAPRVIYEE